MNIQPKDSGGGSGETRESIVMKQAQDMLSRLPEDYIPHEVMTTFLLSSQFSFPILRLLGYGNKSDCYRKVTPFGVLYVSFSVNYITKWPSKAQSIELVNLETCRN